MTTSINLKIKLKNTEPSLGPPLKYRIWIDQDIVYNGELIDQDVVEINPTIDDNIMGHTVGIEHHDRDIKNTLTDENDEIIQNAIIVLQSVKIENVWFHVDTERNFFYPNYSDDYLDWMRKNRTETNFPDKIAANRKIGINGTLRMEFMWPLHLFGLYRDIFIRPCNTIGYHENEPKFDPDMYDLDEEQPIKLYMSKKSDDKVYDRVWRIIRRFTKLGVKIQLIYDDNEPNFRLCYNDKLVCNDFEKFSLVKKSDLGLDNT